MEMWREHKKMLLQKIEEITEADVVELALVGVPMLLMAAEGGMNEEVKRDGKELFCKAIEKLDEMGILKPDAPLRQTYKEYMKELKPKTEDLPLSDAFKNITLSDILNIPLAKDIPNN